MRALKGTILFAALALFAWIVAKSEPLLIWGQIVSLKWRLALVISAYLIIYYFDTMGWRWAFRRQVKLPGIFGLFLARQAGEALNYTTPTAYLGGEPIKALVLKRRYGVALIDGLSSVVIAKTALFLSKAAFLFAGIILALRLFGFGSAVLASILWTFVFVAGLFLLFVYLQRRGLFRMGLLLARKFKLNEMLEEKKGRIEELDEAIKSFYAKERARFLGSFAFHLLGWFAGAIEVYIILYFLGIPTDWTKALVIEVFFKTANSAFFFVPAALGVQEGAGYAVFTGLGFGGPAGVALSLTKRIREMAWAGFGLLVFTRFSKQGAPDGGRAGNGRKGKEA